MLLILNFVTMYMPMDYTCVSVDLPPHPTSVNRPPAMHAHIIIYIVSQKLRGYYWFLHGSDWGRNVSFYYGCVLTGMHALARCMPLARKFSLSTSDWWPLVAALKNYWMPCPQGYKYRETAGGHRSGGPAFFLFYFLVIGQIWLRIELFVWLRFGTGVQLVKFMATTRCGSSLLLSDRNCGPSRGEPHLVVQSLEQLWWLCTSKVTYLNCLNSGVYIAQGTKKVVLFELCRTKVGHVKHNYS